MSTKALLYHIEKHSESESPYWEVWLYYDGWYCEGSLLSLPEARAIAADIHEEHAEDGLTPPETHIVRVRTTWRIEP